MGHERIGILPKTMRWKKVVGQISYFSSENNNIASIAQGTLKNVRKRFENIEQDKGVAAAFQFLVLLSYAAKQSNPKDFLVSKGIQFPDIITPLQIAKAVSRWISQQSESNEYATVAQNAVIDAISEWYQKNNTGQTSFLFSGENPFDVWRKAADGSGFCELSRLYFSKFTERYLNYFLEREASENVNSIHNRIEFGKELEKHIQDISKHAFETSKITQSFAAGWFNKNAKDTIPSSKKIQGFLALAFGKMRDELLREEDSQS